MAEARQIHFTGDIVSRNKRYLHFLMGRPFILGTRNRLPLVRRNEDTDFKRND